MRAANLKTWFAVSMFLAMMLGTARGQIIYVDVDAAGPTHDGTSWQNAYQYLQDALADANLAVKPVEIRVAQGTYVPDANSDDPGGSGDRSAAFQLIEGVTIKGGYAGYGEPNADARDIELYETILSGDLAGNDVPVNDPCDLLSEPTRGENSYHVVIGTGADATAVLDGFTITGGHADGGGTYGHGGGMYCNNGSPMLTNCTFSNNESHTFGGGMYNYGGSPTVTNCSFSQNTSASNGAGMWSGNSSSTIINCSFRGNIAAGNGSGMFNEGGSLKVTNCTFINNQAGGSGGAMRNYNSSPTVVNCTFTDNLAASGGGMINAGNSSPKVTNCTFSGNQAASYGGGMYNSAGSPMVINCTFSGNNAAYDGGGMYNSAGSPIVTNCILWGDTPDEIYGGAPTVTYSDVEGWPGTGNIDADPLFVNAAGGDLRLSSSASPCVDAGDNDSVPADTADLDGDGNTVEVLPWDLDGGARIVDGNSDGNSVVDMGAYERRGRIYVDVDAPGPVHDGSSWANAYKYLQDGLADADSGVKPVEIWMAEGTYNPDANSSSPDGTGARDAAFVLIDHVAVIGGFAGYGEPNSDARDIKLYETTLSGDLDGNDVDVNQPWELFDSNRGENSYHVVVAFEVDGNAVLDGFTIRGGNADGFSEEDASGGGMLCSNGSPMVLNCTFIMNAAFAGGGMANLGGHPVVTGCTFRTNVAEGGGGMVNFDVNPPIRITNCSFVGNAAAFVGAAVANVVVDCAMTNCRFSGNWAVLEGGAVYNTESNSLMTNCTFGGNYAWEAGGAVFDVAGGHLALINSILWCDTAADGNEIAVVEGSTVDVNYCDVKGGEGDVFNAGGTVHWGPGNIETDPCFVAPGYWGDVNDTSTPVEPDDPNAVWVDGDYRLLAGSPCIDTADNNSVPQDTADLDGDGNTVELIPWDLDGGARVVDGDSDGNSVVDMGAYELAIPPVPPVPPVAVTMKFTPQALNTCSNGKAKAHFVFPDDYEVEDINTGVPATLSLLGVEVQSEEIKILGAEKNTGPVKVQITFYRAGLCVIETDEDYAEVTVTGYFSNGQKYMGTDTIKIITNQ